MAPMRVGMNKTLLLEKVNALVEVKLTAADLAGFTYTSDDTDAVAEGIAYTWNSTHFAPEVA
jgi:hypothetical protein